jgi:Domain of unknown function (DUF4159)/Aerotolerance regulator N-terminal
MTLGALAFLNPWALAALVSLPLIYLLLKTVPPRPRQVEFPPTRILVGLENKEKTPAKTPWWLLLIRLLAATLAILALSEPVLNPAKQQTLKGSGPVAIVIDNGWASAAGWQTRLTMAERLIGEAQASSRPVIILETASGARSRKISVEAPKDARATLAALAPQPFSPNRKGALAALEGVLRSGKPGVPSILWLADGIDHDGQAVAFADGLAALAGEGTFATYADPTGGEALGVSAGVGQGGKLTARVLRSGGLAREGAVYAFSARGQRLGEAPFRLANSETAKDLGFELPLELRNQIARVEISGERSAGAVSLLDARSQWQRVGLISGESVEQSQPLLAPLYYIEKAIHPFAEIVRPKDQNLAEGVAAIFKQNASVLMLADIGTLSGAVEEQVEDWVNRGGILIRFAGPRLEKGGDRLLPVALRSGGRTLGGALSWSVPQPLAPFDETGLFAGLTIPPDVAINRQVLADPAELTGDVMVLARLKDGTPLVTAAKRGAGQVVLFHVTANSDWSNLPISGLFVEMLRRITTLGSLAGRSSGDGGASATNANEQAGSSQPEETLAPVLTLDGFGVLRPPPPTAEAIAAAKIADAVPNLAHPPGYYGAAGSPRSVNILGPKSTLTPLPSLPSGAEARAYEDETANPLMPWLLSAALGLLFADILAVLFLLGGHRFHQERPAAAALLLMMLFAGLTVFSAVPALAQSQKSVSPAPPNDAVIQRATEKVTLGYVLTGNARADQTSRAGLLGLSRILAIRTAVEPGEPMGVDIVNDEIAFFPVLYWPVLKTAEGLPEATLAKIDAFMKQGGMIIFDTRDFGTGRPSGTLLGGRSASALQRLIGSLDLPRLEPVPEGHVLTKSFYLLRTFPGRWDGGQLWVEAGSTNQSGSRRARRADGVTSIIVTSNDLASAWALDARGRPLFPVVPGGEAQREMAMRTGVNIVMHALTGNYKADQVHVPALLERLGQ